MRSKIRFELLIERLTAWWKKKFEIEEDNNLQLKESTPPENPNISQDKIKQPAEQRVRVMPAMRWQVFQCDEWKWVACGRSADDGVILHIDHIVPRSKGGADVIANYQTLCSECNLGKSNRDDTDLRNKNQG